MYNLFAKYSTIALAACLLSAGCSSNGNDRVMARAFDRNLYESDLQGIVPPGLSEEDSLALVENYVQQWVQEMVILEKAEKNINDDFKKELENYKNSLLSYRYECSIVEQNLDTNITYNEIQKYYDEHKESFTLKNNIVRAIYVKIPSGSTSASKFRQLFSGDITDKKIMELNNFAPAYAEQYHLDPDSWITFMDFQNVIPVKTYNEELYLQSAKDIYLKDKEYTYFAKILDSKVVNEYSPLNFEYQNIKAIILNNRKVGIIEKMRSDLLKEARINNDVEYYYRTKNEKQ